MVERSGSPCGRNLNTAVYKLVVFFPLLLATIACFSCVTALVSIYYSYFNFAFCPINVTEFRFILLLKSLSSKPTVQLHAYNQKVYQ